MDVASQMKSYSGFLSHAVKRFCKLAVEVIMEPTLVCSLPNSLTHSLHGAGHYLPNCLQGKIAHHQIQTNRD
jgi:hypothetical protein